jgi:hypothetical protein
MAASSDGRSSKDPVAISTPWGSFAPASRRRRSARTGRPLATSWRVISLPVVPLAPVTKIIAVLPDRGRLPRIERAFSWNLSPTPTGSHRNRCSGSSGAGGWSYQ